MMCVIFELNLQAFIDTKENDIQGEHCHIQGLCKQNGVLQSQLNISVDEHIVIEGNFLFVFLLLM